MLDAAAAATAPAEAATKRGARAADLGALALHVAAAAALLGAHHALSRAGLVPPLPARPFRATSELVWPALLLAVMVAVHVAGARGRAVALAAGTAILLAAIRPGGAVLLLALWWTTWRIAALPLEAGKRALLAIAAVALGPALRSGLLGTTVASAVMMVPGLDPLVWGSVLVRALLYQVERTRLAEGDRGFGAYLGSLGLLALGGGVVGAAVPHGVLLGGHRARSLGTLRWGLWLVALGVAYAAAARALGPHAMGVANRIAAAAREGTLDAALDATGRPALLAALVLWLPCRYLQIAGRIFLLVGALGLVGFHLPAGFHRPFLARSFADMWRRWNHYVRDSAMLLFFFPALGVLRRRLRPPAAQAAAVAVSFVGIAALEFVLQPASLWPVRSTAPASVAVGSILRLAVIGLLVAVAAYRAAHRTVRREETLGGRARGIAVTVGATALLSVGAGLVAAGLGPGELARILAFLARVPAP